MAANTTAKQKPKLWQGTDSLEVICSNCGYVYRVEVLKEPSEYNDFGQRYCPLCGMLVSE